MKAYHRFRVIRVTSSRSASGSLLTKIHMPDEGPRFIPYNYSFNDHLENAINYLEEHPILCTIVGTTDYNEIIIA